MQGLVRTCLEMCAVDLTEVHSPDLFNEPSMQLALSTEVAADLETGWNMETKSRRDRCSNELRVARPKALIACPPCPLCKNYRIELEADTRHVAMVLRDLGLERSSPFVPLVAKRSKS